MDLLLGLTMIIMISFQTEHKYISPKKRISLAYSCQNQCYQCNIGTSLLHNPVHNSHTSKKKSGMACKNGHIRYFTRLFLFSSDSTIFDSFCLQSCLVDSFDQSLRGLGHAHLCEWLQGYLETPILPGFCLKEPLFHHQTTFN